MRNDTTERLSEKVQEAWEEFDGTIDEFIDSYNDLGRPHNIQYEKPTMFFDEESTYASFNTSYGLHITSVYYWGHANQWSVKF